SGVKRAGWGQAREPCQTLCPVGRQRPPLGRGVFFAVCGPLAAAVGLADVGTRHGWERRGPRLHRPDDPRGLSRPRSAACLAGTSRAEGALSRRPPYRLGRAGERADSGRCVCGVTGRWRIRWDPPATSGAGCRMVVCVPNELPHDGGVGGGDLSSRYLGGVQQTRDPRRVIGGVVYPGKLWSDYAALLLGQGI